MLRCCLHSGVPSLPSRTAYTQTPCTADAVVGVCSGGCADRCQTAAVCPQATRLAWKLLRQGWVVLAPGRSAVPICQLCGDVLRVVLMLDPVAADTCRYNAGHHCMSEWMVHPSNGLAVAAQRMRGLGYCAGRAHGLHARVPPACGALAFPEMPACRGSSSLLSSLRVPAGTHQASMLETRRCAAAHAVQCWHVPHAVAQRREHTARAVLSCCHVHAACMPDAQLLRLQALQARACCSCTGLLCTE